MTKKGISDAVNRALDGMGFLRLPLRHDLINYSALARFIAPIVKEKVGGEAGTDAIIMAIRRYVQNAARQDDKPDVLDVLGKAKLVLRTGMVVMHYRRGSDVYWRLVDIEKNKVNWHLGDKMNIIQRSEEIMVVASHKLLPFLESAASKEEILTKIDDLALVTVEWPVEANSTPGTLAFVAGQLESISVNIISAYNTLTKMSFVLSESDAAKAYERLSRSLEECRKATAANHTK